ncbi:hypothetical protein J2797_005884 [Paraburkholderia terricola]|uniref:HPP family protein n=1 Tax=Paraburkholderia terricola TaxID=169427 RepID=A0ABU1M1S5_9BURK|nr:hypothetical protein [Paraburkholderia terricola]MDR6495959.1 hypothetical protein [Paraburkholderia terricola]
MTRCRLFVRALLVCSACLAVAGLRRAEVASFPLIITALIAHLYGRADLPRIAMQLCSHALSAMGAALVHFLSARGTWSVDWMVPMRLPVGCLLLLLLQFSRLRHPPALASGGAVLCGLDPVAVIGCVVTTASVFALEFAALCRKRLGSGHIAATHQAAEVNERG